MVQCVCPMSIQSIGDSVRSVLTTAQKHKRIVLGFAEAIKLLSKTPEDVEFVFLAEPKDGDSATHMNEVLLQAFCYEHGIYIIKVDSSQKLATMLGTKQPDEACVLIRKSSSTIENEAANSSDEDILTNFCENCWDNINKCIVKLPES